MIEITVKGPHGSATAVQTEYGYMLTLPSGTEIYKRTRIEMLTQLVDSIEYLENRDRRVYRAV